jgi:GNAT superfamily N-acetyltransferase
MRATTLRVRTATPADVDDIFRLIGALASYEHLSTEVTGTRERLGEHLFGPRPYAEVLLAELAGRPIGFALFFYGYSTFRTAPCLYLEDLFVETEQRRRGVGTTLLARVARLALERGCARLEWAVLDWNAPAIAFYEQHGADVLPDWRRCRITGDALARLARRTVETIPA